MKVYKNIDLKKNQLQNAVIHNVSALPDKDDSLPGQIVYFENDSPLGELYFFNGEDWINSGSSDTNGFVFITDIVAQDTDLFTVSTKEFQGGYEQGALESCLSDTTNVRVTFRASSNNITYKPILVINGETIQPENINEENGNAGIFTGSIDLSLTEQDEDNNYPIVISSNGGAISQTIVEMDQPPVITSATFTGGYPTYNFTNGPSGTQTELKAGDTFNINIQSDIPFVAVQFDDSKDGNDYATQSETISVSEINDVNVTATIANHGTQTQDLPARLRVQKDTGAWSAWVLTSDFGAGDVDGEHTVKLNNIQPTIANITQDNITYPSGQSALKNSETAEVTATLTNVTDAYFDSPNGDLVIDSPEVDANTKTVTRNAGSYNINTNNYRIQAWRADNGAVASPKQGVVYIANVPPTITINSPNRLKSGGNDNTEAVNHTIHINSNQRLASVTSLDASIGTWQGSWSGTANLSTNWNRSLQIHDNDTKGTGTFSNLLVTGISGLTQDTINSGDTYNVSGFVERDIILVKPDSEVDMNVAIVPGDYDKVNLTWSAKATLTQRAPIDTEPPLSNNWCLLNPVDTRPVTIRLLDTSAVESSTSTTTTITISG